MGSQLEILLLDQWDLVWDGSYSERSVRTTDRLVFQLSQTQYVPAESLDHLLKLQ